jgi:hypothetical protein
MWIKKRGHRRCAPTLSEVLLVGDWIRENMKPVEITSFGDFGNVAKFTKCKFVKL